MTDDAVRTLLSELVTTASRFTRLAAYVAPDTRPRTWSRALSLLEEHEPLRISEFARLDRCSQPSATALLKTLDENGLVTRTTDPIDSRAVVVETTDAGRQWLAETRHAIGDALLDHLPGLDAERLERLTTEFAEIRALGAHALDHRALEHRALGHRALEHRQEEP